MKDIRVNEPGAGERIMRLCEGVFRPEMDHSIASFDGERFLGGFVLCQYLGGSIAVHDGAVDPRWCSRDMLWMLFHYIFRQLGCHKAFAPTPSDNYHALDLNMRAGWRVEAILRDALAPGRHLIVLSMEAGACRWLLLQPRRYFPSSVVKDLVTNGETLCPGSS